jgi:flagellar motor switch protein FliG
MRVLGAFLLAVSPLAPAAALSGASDIPDAQIIDQENLLRREAEQKIQKEILDRILGEGRATVLVNVEIGLETEKKDSATSEGQVEDKKKFGDQDFILPWVPAPKTVNKQNEVPKDAKMESASGQIASAEVRQTVRRFDVTVIHDDSVGAGQLTLVEEAVKSAYSRFERVLKVLFKPTKFARFEMSEKIKEGFWDFLKPQYLLPGTIALLLLLFLFGPLLTFLRALLKAMTARREMSTETQMKTEAKNKDELDEQSKLESEENSLAEEAKREAEEEKMKKFVPFSYIDETNLQRLIYLISREPPEIIAIIASYLKPEFVKQMLAPLLPELQAKVAMHMAAVTQTSEAEVRALDKDVRDKIDYVVGGMQSLVKVLNDVDFKIRDNILEYLKNERPRLYEKVRRHILMFSDIPSFPDAALQVVVRELRAESLAHALRDVSPQIAERFFSCMSKGAVALLKEEMEYSRPLSPDQAEEERQKILGIVKKLETEGRIKIREKPSEDFLDLDDIHFISGFQRGAAPGAAVPAAADADPAKAREYLAAGAQLTAEGKYAEALPYLEYAVQLGPSLAEAQQYLGNVYYSLGRVAEALAAFERAAALNPQDQELRRWVDQFRASVAATA